MLFASSQWRHNVALPVYINKTNLFVRLFVPFSYYTRFRSLSSLLSSSFCSFSSQPSSFVFYPAFKFQFPVSAVVCFWPGTVRFTLVLYIFPTCVCSGYGKVRTQLKWVEQVLAGMRGMFDVCSKCSGYLQKTQQKWIKHTFLRTLKNYYALDMTMKILTNL